MRSKHHLYQAGFGLIEIMVGLAIGMLTTLVIMQVFSVFEEQKRATTGSADAQTSGSVALYTIGRDLQMAGFGLLPVVDSALECNPSPLVDHDGDPVTPSIDLTPLTITDGGAAAGATDSIDIRYGTTPMGGVPSEIKSPAAGVAGVTTVTVDNNLGCRVNDIAVTINGTAACSATRVDALVGTGQITLHSGTGVVAGANLACLGNWSQQVYSTSGGNLTLNGAPILSGVVNVQAQYGISATASSNQVTQWVEATAATGWDAPSVANRNRIKAIRIAVVARNGQYEKTNVTTACSSLTAVSPTGLCAWAGTATSPAPSIDLSNDADWQRYRYRVFETIIPLRNVIWSRETL